jgi:hypothetical protein
VQDVLKIQKFSTQDNTYMPSMTLGNDIQKLRIRALPPSPHEWQVPRSGDKLEESQSHHELNKPFTSDPRFIRDVFSPQKHTRHHSEQKLTQLKQDSPKHTALKTAAKLGLMSNDMLQQNFSPIAQIGKNMFQKNAQSVRI